MATLIDTSALYALLDADDPRHRQAAAAFDDVAQDGLLTHNYVVLETTAIVHRRLGATAVRELHEDLLGAVDVEWVGPELHRAGVTALLAAARRRLSLADWVTFEVMRRRGIERAFAFDRDFAAQGFETVP